MRLIIGEFRKKKVVMIVGHKTEKRLAGTCFRPLSQPRAGNFRSWRSPRQVIERRDMLPKFREECLDALMDCVQEGEECFSFTVEDTIPVGWESTDKLEKFTPDELEPMRLNKRATALKVKVSSGKLAPATKHVTFIVDLKINSDEYVLLVRSMYPGEDVGELVGDVSQREKVAFYDWNHEGEKIPATHERTSMGLEGH